MLGFLIFAGIGILLVIYMWRQANRDKVESLHLPFATFPESFNELKLFFISDIHRRTVSKRLVKKLEGKADIVIIGGDLLEKGVPFARVKKNIERLKAIGPVYFVWGNNDYEVDYHQLDALLLNMNVKILDNASVLFESEQGDVISLVGVDCLTNHRDRLDLALQGCEQIAFKILVSHDPAIIKKITKEQNISFVLSGHTHGGQIRLGKWGLYKKGGLEQAAHTLLLISNGYGTSTLPLRLGAPAETHFITIRNANRTEVQGKE